MQPGPSTLGHNVGTIASSFVIHSSARDWGVDGSSKSAGSEIVDNNSRIWAVRSSGDRLQGCVGEAEGVTVGFMVEGIGVGGNVGARLLGMGVARMGAGVMGAGVLAMGAKLLGAGVTGMAVASIGAGVMGAGVMGVGSTGAGVLAMGAKLLGAEVTGVTVASIGAGVMGAGVMGIGSTGAGVLAMGAKLLGAGVTGMTVVSIGAGVMGAGVMGIGSTGAGVMGVASVGAGDTGVGGTGLIVVGRGGKDVSSVRVQKTTSSAVISRSLFSSLPRPPVPYLLISPFCLFRRYRELSVIFASVLAAAVAKRHPATRIADFMSIAQQDC